MFSIILVVLSAYVILHFFYQLFWGKKPLRALVLGVLGLLAIAFWGGQWVAGLTLWPGSGTLANTGLLGIFVGVLFLWEAFDGSLVAWMPSFRNVLKVKKR